MILSELDAGVVVTRSSLLEQAAGITHAISTRMGGVSEPPPYRSLNLSWKWNGSLAAVEVNHRRLCGSLHLDRASLISPEQVHGVLVAKVGKDDRGRQIPGCDGLITQSSDVTLLLRFADCVPILLYDSRRHIVGLAHAGWRGTVGGIATRAVQAMAREFGTDPADILAVIGPSIGPCCYEVGDDVIAATHTTFGSDTALLSTSPGEGQSATLAPSQSAPTCSPFRGQSDSSKKHLDLWAANEQLLRASGVTCIEVARLCTSCLNATYFSYRAGRGCTGAHGALICLRN